MSLHLSLEKYLPETINLHLMILIIIVDTSMIEKSTFLAVISLLALPFSVEAITLQQVFNVSPKLTNFTPGPYALHISEQEATVKVDGKLWEVRYVTYTDVKGNARHRTLQQLAKDYNFAEQEGREFEVNPALKTITWFSTDAMKDKGIYYTVSIKSLESNIECIGCES